jgi:hypothetical protein
MRSAPVPAIVLAALALALAGCGGDDSPSAEPQPPPAPQTDTGGFADVPLEPAEPPPDAMEGGPPPAGIATQRGSHWLAYATFCWERGCADYMPPRCGDPSVPEVAVTEGEAVSFHLGFEPTSVSLTFFSGASDTTVPLDPSSEPRWTVDREGPVWLSTQSDTGDAAYAACLRFDSAAAADTLTVEQALARAEGEVAVTGTIYAEGDDVRLCDALAESYPPQCPGRFLRLEGFDLGSVQGLSRERDIVWGDQPTTVRGMLRGATLVVSS